MVSIKKSDSGKNVMWLQWMAGIGAMLATFTVSLMIGWTSPYLAKLIAEDSPLPITKDEASWVASLFNLGRLIGAIFGGVVVQYVGSKRTLTILGFPLMFSFVCIIVANSVTWLYVARISSGISLGMTFSSFPIFLGEVSSPMLRGAMVSLAIAGMQLGNLVGNIMGAYLTMTVFSCISLVPNVIFVVLFLWLPESPYYLVRLGKLEDAKKSIARYNPQVDATTEVESLKDFMSTSDSLTLLDRLREFNIPRNRNAGIITLLLFAFVQFSGLNTLLFYQEIILTNAQVTVISPATVVMIASAVSVVSGWISVYIADKFERKVLTIVGSIGTGISIGALAIHFNLIDAGFDPEPLQWLPITAMLLVMYWVSNGFASVPNMLISELFAPNIKGLAACFGSISVGLFSFIATKTYQPLVDAMGEAYVYWLFTALMALCIIFAAIFIPQTKGKSLQEIQNALMKK